MASVCISDCVNNTRLPLRPTFTNVYKWPESDVEFVKTVNSNNRVASHARLKGIDSFSCRQKYLRSYQFSKRKIGVTEKTLKCFNKLKESVVCASKKLILKGKYKTLKCFNKLKESVVCASKKLNLKRKYKTLRCFNKLKESVVCASKKLNLKRKYKTLRCFNKLKESVVCASKKLNFKGKYKALVRAKYVTFSAFSMLHLSTILCKGRRAS